MRFTVLVGLSPILLTMSCYLPRPWKSAGYADSCVALDQPPPRGAQLFLTLRLPRCTPEGVELTQFRAQQVWYAARTGGAFGARIFLYRQNRWEAALDREVKDAGRPPVFFIHGYNNSNLEALRRAALIAWAVKGQNPVVALTWPSYAKTNFYIWDEANSEWALDPASDSVSYFVARYPGTVIVAHSMGNRIALASVAKLESNGQASKIGRLIMAAPDVDRAALGRSLRAGLGVDVTLYGSLRDQPLSASWRAHGYPRAGDLSWWVTGRQPYYAFAGIPRLEVIDTTGVDRSMLGHAAFIETPEGAADLCRVVEGQGSSRLGLRHNAGEPSNYWHLMLPPMSDACTWAPPPRAR